MPVPAHEADDLRSIFRHVRIPREDAKEFREKVLALSKESIRPFPRKIQISERAVCYLVSPTLEPRGRRRRCAQRDSGSCNPAP